MSTLKPNRAKSASEGRREGQSTTQLYGFISGNSVQTTQVPTPSCALADALLAVPSVRPPRCAEHPGHAYRHPLG